MLLRQSEIYLYYNTLKQCLGLIYTCWPEEILSVCLSSMEMQSTSKAKAFVHCMFDTQESFEHTWISRVVHSRHDAVRVGSEKGLHYPWGSKEMGEWRRNIGTRNRTVSKHIVPIPIACHMLVLCFKHLCLPCTRACVCVGNVHVTGTLSGQRDQAFLELQWQAVVSHLVWVLRTELGLREGSLNS